LEYKIRRGIIDYKLRKLVLNDEYIKYDNDLFSINNLLKVNQMK